MCGSIVCVAAVMLGIDAGWQPLPEGGVEYHIQIEPHVLDTLKSGQPIYSDIPPQVENVRAYKISVGTGQLARELPTPAKTDSPPAAESSDSQRTTVDKPPANAPFPYSPIPSAWPNASHLPSSPYQQEVAAPGTPHRIEPDPASKPIDGVRQAAHVNFGGGTAQSDSKSPSDQRAESLHLGQQEPGKQWVPLTVALFTLFGSLGANFYLGWITWGTRARYRALVGGLGNRTADP